MSNEIFKMLNKINDEKEKFDVIDELLKIGEYKEYIRLNNVSNHEIDKFIKNIIDKYRNELLVKDYYKPNTKDRLSVSQYNNLCVIENMIINYIKRKNVIEIIDNINKNGGY